MTTLQNGEVYLPWHFAIDHSDNKKNVHQLFVFRSPTFRRSPVTLQELQDINGPKELEQVFISLTKDELVQLNDEILPVSYAKYIDKILTKTCPGGGYDDEFDSRGDPRSRPPPEKAASATDVSLIT